MGASRINGALLDLKAHAAATSLKVSEQDGNFLFDSLRAQLILICMMSAKIWVIENLKVWEMMLLMWYVMYCS